MSEDNNGNGKVETEKKKDLVLTITFSTENGSINTTGPGNGKTFDEPICFWMLEKSKDFIKNHNANIIMQSKIIHQKNNNILNFVRNRIK